MKQELIIHLLLAFGFCKKFDAIFAQLNGIDFRGDYSFNMNLNLGLKSQFPDLLVEFPQVGLLSQILDLAENIELDQLEEISPNILKVILLENATLPLSRKTILTALSFLGTLISQRLDSTLLLSQCSASSRYVSSFMGAWTSLRSAWNDPTAVFPIAARIRDLSITRNKCVEDSLVSVLSLLRSFKQTNPSVDIAPIIAPLLQSVPLVRLLGGKWPIIGLLISIEESSSTNLRLIQPVPPKPTVHASSKWIATGPPIWGFDCPSGELDALRLNNTGNSTCTAGTLVRKLFNREELGKTERLFLQSINANWFPILATGWGLLITKGLSEMRREDQIFSDPLCSISSEKSTTKLEIGLETIINVHPDCTVALAAGYVLVHTAFLERSEVLRDDLATLLELAWQTIAGDELELVVQHQIPLFKLMHEMWSSITPLDDTECHSD